MRNSLSFSTAILIVPVLLTSLFPSIANANRVAATSQGGAEITVPAHAIEKAPGLFYLGESYDEDSAQMVEGYMIIHPRDAAAKGGKGGNKPGGDTGNSSPTASCYGFISSGAKWKSAEPWVVNPQNNYGMSEVAVFDVLKAGINKWEDAADGVIDGNETKNIFGTAYSLVSPVVQADTASTDGTNEVHFGDLGAGTIGVTIVWGRFSGPTRQREIVEWDQVYNTDYQWSLTGAAGTYDFESIATHELGHSFGLADLYVANCSTMSMYGYGTLGDINQRSLEDGDINGMNALY